MEEENNHKDSKYSSSYSSNFKSIEAMA